MRMNPSGSAASTCDEAIHERVVIAKRLGGRAAAEPLHPGLLSCHLNRLP